MPGGSLAASDLGRGLEAIQNRQLAVHQHQPVAPSRHLLHGLLAVANAIGVIAEPGEDGDATAWLTSLSSSRRTRRGASSAICRSSRPVALDVGRVGGVQVPDQLLGPHNRDRPC